MRSVSSRPHIPRKLRDQTIISRRQRPANEKIAFIIATHNSAAGIIKTLLNLQPYRFKGHEVILVDGGSNDDTLSLSETLVDQIIETNSDAQTHLFNIASRHAWSDNLIFNNVGILLPDDADEYILNALNKCDWGFFYTDKITLNPLTKAFIKLQNIYYRASRTARFEHSLFIKRELFEQLRGFNEDSDNLDRTFFSALGKQHKKPCVVRKKSIVT